MALEDTASTKPTSRYQEYLPALLQGDPVVGQFLQAFEKILSGSTAASSSPSFTPQVLRFRNAYDQPETLAGFEEILRHIHLYFNPDEGKTPREFLPWLASWVALNLREDWPEETQRKFIRQIVPLYRLRGTKPGLEKILELYLEGLTLRSRVTVYDQFDRYPNYFQVQITLPYPDPNIYWKQVRIAKAIIDQEKPANTYYALRILTPSMRLTGRMFPLELSAVATAKTVRVTVKTEGTQAAFPVKLVVGLHADSASPAYVQLGVHGFGQGERIEYRVEATRLAEQTGWQVALQQVTGSNGSALPEGRLMRQTLESLYLSLNNLNRSIVTVEVEMDGQTSTLTLHPALQIYREYDLTLKNLAAGDTFPPTEGRCLIAIAKNNQNDQDTLRFCIFDEQGNRAIETDESKLTDNAKSTTLQQLADLKALLKEDYWQNNAAPIPPPVKSQIIRKVRSLLEYTADPIVPGSGNTLIGTETRTL